jgi:hypothetical protein
MRIYTPSYSNLRREILAGSCIFIFLVLLLPASLSCQVTFEKVYGHTWAECGYSVLQTADSGYIICGSSGSFPSKNDDVYIVKTDQSGNLLWNKNYGGSWNETGYSISKTSDGGYIISAEYFHPVENVVKSYLLRINSEGDTLWTKYYSEMGNNNARCALESYDGGIIFCGANLTLSSSDGFIMKTDASGETLWSKTYGAINDTWFYDMNQTADSGYIICGGIETAPGYDDFYIVKTDSSGDTLWTRHYGGPAYDAAYSVVENSDGTYVVAGEYWNTVEPTYFDVMLIKLNHQGDTIWMKRYGGYQASMGHYLDHTSDGGYIVCGRTRSCISCIDDMYLLKVDSEGNELWSETFGGLDYESAMCVHETYDGGYIMSGYTKSFGNGNGDIYLIKTDSEGLLTGINNHITDDGPENSIYPNPNHGNFTIRLPEGSNKVQIINQQGQLLFTKDFKTGFHGSPIQIDVPTLPKGLYMLRIIRDLQTLKSEKLIIY